MYGRVRGYIVRLDIPIIGSEQEGVTGDAAAGKGREVFEGVEGGSPAFRAEHQGDIGRAAAKLQQLLNKQIELARTELIPVARQAGIATGLLVVGAVFMLLFLVFFFLTGMYFMVEVFGFPYWAAAGIDTVILLVIGGALAGAGANKLRTLDPKPHRTIAALQENVEWVKGKLKP